jgi:hypothetical protein
LKESGEIAARRQAAALSRAVDLVRRRIGEVGVEALGGDESLVALLLSFLRAGGTSLDAAERACAEAIARLRSPHFSSAKR